MSTVDAPDGTAQTITLKDGRLLGYAEYGDPNGKPVLEFHGWPSCRLEASVYDEAAKKLGARIIAIDRPGFGLSTYKNRYRIIDWPKDVAEFAGALELGRFAALGISSGSPYVLACARYLSNRLTACAVVSGLASLKVEGEKIDPKQFVIKDAADRRPSQHGPLRGQADLLVVRARGAQEPGQVDKLVHEGLAPVRPRPA